MDEINQELQAMSDEEIEDICQGLEFAFDWGLMSEADVLWNTLAHQERVNRKKSC